MIQERKEPKTLSTRFRGRRIVENINMEVKHEESRYARDLIQIPVSDDKKRILSDRTVAEIQAEENAQYGFH